MHSEIKILLQLTNWWVFHLLTSVMKQGSAKLTRNKIKIIRQQRLWLKK